jgi:hypothetical protein
MYIYMWFDTRHLKYKNPILLEDLHGYVLPHAGTEFTGSIISHTLRFRPMKKIKKIIIIYYPTSKEPDVDDKYYHEYYVPWQSLLTILGPDYIYEGYDIGKDKIPLLELKDSLFVVSADFSHFLPFQKAIDIENKAAHSLMFKELLYQQVVDDLKTFKILFDTIPAFWQLQWIGRDRSNGLKAVGYLSFLIREIPKVLNNVDGLFVTVYDKSMVARECQGKWFSSIKKWSLLEENKLINEVIALGETTSRLTGGLNRETPLTHYTLTYLYKDTVNPFIRGWHGIFQKAFYLPEVFLENTFTNGKWITSNDTTWPVGESKFVLTETLQHLRKKAGYLVGGKLKRSVKKYQKKRKTIKYIHSIMKGSSSYTLYSSRVAHFRI